MIDGHLYDLKLKWRTAEQGFEIIEVRQRGLIIRKSILSAAARFLRFWCPQIASG